MCFQIGHQDPERDSYVGQKMIDAHQRYQLDWLCRQRYDPIEPAHVQREASSSATERGLGCSTCVRSKEESEKRDATATC
jgi:hypothetical protein